MKTLIFIICLGFILTGCKKNSENPYQSQGVITGYDMGMCMMCGGLEITIKNDPSKNPPPFHKINETLQQLGISESTKFPISVSLDWKRDTSSLAAYNFVLVSKIKVNN